MVVAVYVILTVLATVKNIIIITEYMTMQMVSDMEMPRGST